MERAYTVSELDELRGAVGNKYLWGRYSGSLAGESSRSYRPDEMAQVVETRVRTHMLAGHTAADLIASEQEPTIAHT